MSHAAPELVKVTRETFFFFVCFVSDTREMEDGAAAVEPADDHVAPAFDFSLFV